MYAFMFALRSAFLFGASTPASKAALFREHPGRAGGLGAAGVLVAGDGGWPGIAGALLTAAACPPLISSAQRAPLPRPSR